jgi:hypothetical protein
LRGKVAIGWPDVTQNRSDAVEYQAILEQSRQIADAEPPEATNLALRRQSFARGSIFVTPKPPPLDRYDERSASDLSGGMVSDRL